MISELRHIEHVDDMTLELLSLQKTQQLVELNAKADMAVNEVQSIKRDMVLNVKEKLLPSSSEHCMSLNASQGCSLLSNYGETTKVFL